MSNSKTISTGYQPREHQASLHQALKRFNVLVCHRRFGKSIFSVNHTLDQALRNDRRNPQYAYMCPTFGQAKRVIWSAMKDYILKLPGAVANEADLRIDVSRPWKGDSIRFMLLGAENPDSLRGIYLDGVVMDEYAQMNPITFSEIIRPTLSDRLGWALFIGTPKGRNAFFDLYEYARDSKDPEWFSALYKASETGILPKEELESLRRTMDPDEFEQEYECSFQAANSGNYYSKQMLEAERTGRISSVPYDPAVPVDTYWDLGVGDSTAIWFVQAVGQEVHVIDYVEESGLGLPEYVKILRARSYVYGEIILPHDARARELGTGKTREEVLRSLMSGTRIRVLERAGVDDGIQAVRMLLPRCWFDRARCERGLKALNGYERMFDAKLQVFKDQPLHNWASHGSDAFRALAMGMRRTPHNPNRYLPTQAITEYDLFNPYGSLTP